MTPWHYRWLCQFAYIDLPPSLVRRGQSLGDIARALLDASLRLPCGPLSTDETEALRILRATPALASLVLIDFVNRNAGSGFVAYALRAPDDSVHCILRGSERRGCGVPTPVDWLDNFLTPFFSSVQYEDVSALARRFPDARVTFSGHSKGAHNALYALASLSNDRAAAVVFNGQGFVPGQFTRPQKKRLQRQAIHYVTRGDVVGSLLWHPERRIFVRRQGTENAHALSSLSFDRRGQPVPAHRPAWSLALEAGTRLCLAGLKGHPNMEML